VYAQYLSASGIKQIFVENWLKIDAQDKTSIKDYLLNFLV
jgi:hypothetical protein